MKTFIATLSLLITATISWILIAGKYFFKEIQIDSQISNLQNTLPALILGILLPIFLIWFLFSAIYLAFSFHFNNKHMLSIMYNTRKNTEYIEIIVRTLMEMREKKKLAELIEGINFTLYELSETLSSIISKTEIVNNEILSKIWEQNIQFKIWAFSEIIIDQYENKHNFEENLRRASEKNETLKALLVKFTEKYEIILKAITKTDNDKLIKGFFEEGNIGKVYMIFTKILAKTSITNSPSTKTSDEKKEEDISFFDRF